MTAKQKATRRRKHPPPDVDPREVHLCRAWGCYGCCMCCPGYATLDDAWVARVNALAQPWTSRVTCMRKAARWAHLAAGDMRDDAEWALSWAAQWRAAGKAIPWRSSMGCARARRPRRRGFRLRARNL